MILVKKRHKGYDDDQPNLKRDPSLDTSKKSKGWSLFGKKK